jgi:acetylornithine deacetylase/succinyl-diaminopimelate desuccinylase-like protein
MTILNAYDALVKTGVALKHNIKFFFEGEEELGSTHLDEIFKKHKEKLQTDLWVIIDGPRHVSGKKMISFCNVAMNMNVTVYGQTSFYIVATIIGRQILHYHYNTEHER